MAGKSTLTEKDIADAFARIEDELLKDMMNRLDSHHVQELADGMEWAQWQALQVQGLHDYVRSNISYTEEFDRLNADMEAAIEEAYNAGYADQEAEILDAVRKGWKPEYDEAGFLRPSPHRLDALLAATHSDMMKAEYATLRRVEDIYRNTIFTAQLYAASGAGTYAKAIDMAVGDFLKKGIDGIVYKNGSRHSIREYSQMAVRTAVKRAAFVADGDARRDWGVHTIFVNYRTDACPVCMDWVGQVLVDDVYSGGTAEEADEKGYALLSDAMAAGLFHPNCRDTQSTYFEGVNEPPAPFTKDEMRHSEEHEAAEQELSQAEQKVREYGRVAELALDPQDRAYAAAKRDEWEERLGEYRGALTGAIRGDDKESRERMERHAARYYEELRKRDANSIIERLASSSGLDKESVELAYRHLIIEEHVLDDGVHTFDSDYDIAQSLQRLIDGGDVYAHDIALLQHEALEADYMLDGLSYDDAHRKANERYNYAVELAKWLDERS